MGPGAPCSLRGRPDRGPGALTGRVGTEEGSAGSREGLGQWFRSGPALRHWRRRDRRVTRGEALFGRRRKHQSIQTCALRHIRAAGRCGGLGTRRRRWLSAGRCEGSGGTAGAPGGAGGLRDPPSAPSLLHSLSQGLRRRQRQATATLGAVGRACPCVAGCSGVRSLSGAAAPAAPAVAGPWGRAAAGHGAPSPAEKASHPGADAALSPHTQPLRFAPFLLPMPDGAPRLGDALQQPRRPGRLRRYERSCPRRRGQPGPGQAPSPPPAAVRRL